MFGITGVKSLFQGVDPEMAGSRVDNPSGPTRVNTPEDQAAAEAAQLRLWQQQQQDHQNSVHNRAQGFLGGMMPAGGHAGIQNGLNHAPMVAPPSRWNYQPGQGVVWQDPHRALNPNGTDQVSMNWAYSANPNSIFTGNRI